MPEPTPVPFEALRGWSEDDHEAAFAAFRRSAERHLKRPYKSRSLTRSSGLERVARKAEKVSDVRDFFEKNFVPHLVGTGKLTGYYEPVLPGSPIRTEEYSVPLHRRPPELLDLPDPEMRYGRIVDGHAEPYHDRAEIRAGALDGLGLELVWLRDRVDAFIVHVQGSASIQFSDGSRRRVTYTAKSGHPYSSLGAELLRRLRADDPGLPTNAVTADVLTGWMRNHRDELDDFLAINRSYIFFEEVSDDGDGPRAAAKVPLSSGRSLAVDRTLHAFGLPFWLETDEPLPDQDEPLSRLTIAQDTGSAIVGAARGDLFVGSGPMAGEMAGRINQSAKFVVFVPQVAA